MKNIINLEHYYSPAELEEKISEFVEYYNNQRYHESLNKVTPADVYFRKNQEILERRKNIKQRTILKRRMDFILNKQIGIMKCISQLYESSCPVVADPKHTGIRQIQS